MIEFLADECVFKTTIEFLRSHNYKVSTAYEEKLDGQTNGTILQKAIQTKRILLTADSDFANILVYPPGTHSGIIVLKISKANEDDVHNNLLKLLTEVDSTLIQSLIIVDKNKYRIRTLLI